MAGFKPGELRDKVGRWANSDQVKINAIPVGIALVGLAAGTALTKFAPSLVGKQGKNTKKQGDVAQLKFGKTRRKRK